MSQFPHASATQRYLVPGTNSISIILYVIKMSNESQQMAAISVTQNAICEPSAYIGHVCVNCMALGITFQEFKEFPAGLIRVLLLFQAPLCDLFKQLPTYLSHFRSRQNVRRKLCTISYTTSLIVKKSFLNNNLVSGLYTQLLLLFLKPQTVARLISIVATQCRSVSRLKKGI